MSTVNEIVVSSLISLRECPMKMRFAELSLQKMPDAERRKALFQALDVAKHSMLEKKSMEETLQTTVEYLNEAYEESWFSVPAACRSALDKDTQRIKRMIKYLYSKEVEVIDIDVPYRLNLPGISFKGRKLDVVYGRVDMVVRIDERYEAIRFSSKLPQYSYLARKELNKPDNALELILMKLGLESRYPGVVCSMYYLKGKDDKGDSFPMFEVKKGKNIIQSNFVFYPEVEGLLQHLYSVLDMPTDASCDDCVYHSVCQFKRNVAEAEEPKEPSFTKRVISKMSYTDTQKQVIYHKDGPMNVIAVPGAGKTFSLVERMLYLIRDEHVPANKILFVTFTRKACEEILSRVKAALGTSTAELLPNIFTFNSLGYQILKENPVLLGRRVKLADTVDRLSVIREVLASVPRIKGVSYDGLYMKPNGLIYRLEKEFELMESLGDDWAERTKMQDVEGVQAAYKAYKDIFEKRGFVTYDMQISLCNELFQKCPDLALLYSKAFSYIMVDEFQDVSADNVKMIYSIAKNHNNIVVVGDDDQSIYSFRGGSNSYMLRFADDFPQAKTVVMNDNFRSNDKILSASAELIGNNAERFEKSIVAHREEKFKPVLYRDFQDEQMVGLIGKILKSGYQPSDIAVLGRRNKTLFAAADMVSKYYAVSLPKEYLIDDAAFGMVRDCLNVYYHPDSDAEVYRIMARLGVEEEVEKSMRTETLLFNLLYQVQLPDMKFDEPKTVETFTAARQMSGRKCACAKLFLALNVIAHATSIEQCIAGILRETLLMEDNQVVRILTDMADERAITSPRELCVLLNDMEAFQSDTRINYKKGNAVNFLTAHDAKGKEFPVVIVHCVEDFGEDEEERRLLYVAMTRAKKTLVLTVSQYQNSNLVTECQEKLAVMGGC